MPTIKIDIVNIIYIMVQMSDVATEAITQLRAEREAAKASWWQPANQRELTCEALTMATIPKGRQQNSVEMIAHAKCELGFGICGVGC